MFWQEEYNTGIELLDIEHRMIFQEIHRFEETMGITMKDCSKDLRALLQFIENHILRHFPEEEKLMQEYNFPDFERHKSQHRLFKKFFFEFKDRFEIERASFAAALFTKDTIICWMKTHIANMDRSFGDFLKANVQEKMISGVLNSVNVSEVL